jgi:glycosyltransferase involved in cell wall biosynthesis
MNEVLYISYDGIADPIGQSQVVSYVKGLSSAGIQIVLLSFEKRRRLADKKNILDIEKDLKSNGIRWVRLAYHKNPPVVSTVFDIFCGASIASFAVLVNGLRCVHARSYVAALMALFLKKIFRVKFIFDMRGFWADERVEGRIWKSKGFLYKAAKFLERRFLLNSDHIVVLTRNARLTLNNLGYTIKANITVIPCMVDTQRFRFDPTARQSIRDRYGLSDKFVFLYSGSLEYWYMKEEMLDFFLAAKDVINNTYFLILSTMDKRHIEPLISERRISRTDFMILQNVPYADMPKFISASDTGIFFITPVLSKRASCPTKFAEYISCGLPLVVNSGIGDLDGIISEYKIGTIIDSFSTKEYADKARLHQRLIKNDVIKVRCVKLAEDMFSLDIGVRMYKGIYKRI